MTDSLVCNMKGITSPGLLSLPGCVPMLLRSIALREEKHEVASYDG